MGYSRTLPYGDYFTIGSPRPAEAVFDAAGTDVSLGSIIIPADMNTIKAVYIDWYWWTRINSAGAANNNTNSFYIAAEYGGTNYVGARVMIDSFPMLANERAGFGCVFGYTDCKLGFRPGVETYITALNPIMIADFMRFYGSQIVARVITY